MFLQTTVVNAQRVEELLEQPLEADRQTSAQPDFSAYPAVEFPTWTSPTCRASKCFTTSA